MCQLPIDKHTNHICVISCNVYLVHKIFCNLHAIEVAISIEKSGKNGKLSDFHRRLINNNLYEGATKKKYYEILSISFRYTFAIKFLQQINKTSIRYFLKIVKLCSGRPRAVNSSYFCRRKKKHWRDPS